MLTPFVGKLRCLLIVRLDIETVAMLTQNLPHKKRNEFINYRVLLLIIINAHTCNVDASKTRKKKKRNEFINYRVILLINAHAIIWMKSIKELNWTVL